MCVSLRRSLSFVPLEFPLCRWIALQNPSVMQAWVCCCRCHAQ